MLIVSLAFWFDRPNLVDDESTDGTAAVARRVAEKAGKADALIVIQSKPLPRGWTGNLCAMHQGVERARALNFTWFMFADADVQHDPEIISNLASIASEGRNDLVSLMVKLHCESLPEKLLIPGFRSSGAFQSFCSHQHAGPGCNVWLKASYRSMPIHGTEVWLL